MKSAGYSTFTLLLLFGLFPETKTSNCSKSIKCLKDLPDYKIRLIGEWLVIDCTVNTIDDVTLWFGNKNVTVDNKRVFLVSKNVFNLTNLTQDMQSKSGKEYTCRACGRNICGTKSLGIYLLTEPKAYAVPVIKKNPDNSVYDIGGSVKLECHVEKASNKYRFKWRKVGSSKIITEDTKLSLKSLSESDTGTYECELSRFAVRYITYKSVKISVKGPQAPDIRIKDLRPVFREEEGKPFLLLYNVSSYPPSDISWWKSRDKITWENMVKCSSAGICEGHETNTNITTNSFKMEDLEFPKHNLFYKCNASNMYGSDSKSFQLLVYAIKCLKDLPDYKIRLIGEWLVIDCTVNTIHNVTLWFGNNEMTVDNKRIFLVSKNVFNLTNITQDIGSNKGKEYTCRASGRNVCGTKSLAIYTLSEPKAYAVPEITKKPDYSVYGIGGSVELECHVEKASNKYRFKWRKVGSSKVIREDRKLPLNSLSESDTGTYECELSRYAVRYITYKSVKISVKAPKAPDIRIKDLRPVFHKNERETFVLLYNVSSHPPSDIYWWKSRDKITWEKMCSSSEICEQDEKNTNITTNGFKIEDLEFPKNNLFYKCNASNKYGNDSKSFQLLVYVKPKIKKMQDMVFKQGILINCTLMNKEKINPPKVNYTWHSQIRTGEEKKWKLEAKSSSLRLDTLPKSKMTYQCRAENSAGEATEEVNVFAPTKTVVKSSNQKTTPLIVVPVGIVLLIIFTFLCFVLCKRRKLYGGFYLFSYPPLPDFIEMIDENENLHNEIQRLPFIAEWEFPRERVKFVRELGAGQFGVVWLAEATGISSFHPREILREKEGRTRFFFFNHMMRRNSYVCCKKITNVAVKTVKADYVESSVADIKAELKILIHVGEHENIVNILGACTKGRSSNLWIIMEYCPNGNLREFLRQNRDKYSLEVDWLVDDLSQGFGPKNLMYFALQIAKGMAFLISRKIIHRDLAARNILIGNDYIAKVGDFGLARDVEKYHHYLKKSTGMVPMKWLAIESIRDSIFTEKSDVWSYGILLWEIFALGGNPYPGVHINDFYLFLLSEKRMQPPIHCPVESFNLMSMCWNENPEDRPSFCSIIKVLHEILGFNEIMLEINANTDDKIMSTC
ncbi:fibroblast growth factor receptor 3-like [Dendronephthya gigantea]|uniref:fibroblast growth factor receptor 3-like n=1 Tax=Dendronephthya gigantea TaxID=151771 RepID=UPI00106B0EB5|nr:fibroblast growth factor receptor 3-like [Dendronephthya gigantea]XP_028411445.1 fibroblast growth factor receptor 3-like [Dendronephthya gigantea]